MSKKDLFFNATSIYCQHFMGSEVQVVWFKNDCTVKTIPLSCNSLHLWGEQCFRKNWQKTFFGTEIQINFSRCWHPELTLTACGRLARLVQCTLSIWFTSLDDINICHMAPSKKSSVCDTPVKIENSLGVCEEPSGKKNPSYFKRSQVSV